VFGQELGHRFVAFADIVANPARVLRRDTAHWDHAFNSFASCVGGIGGNLITDIGGGQFRIDAKETTYGDWDEYLMGFLPPASVAASFRVQGANPAPPAAGYPVGQVITGTRVNHTINDIILNEGPRLPDDTLSQRVFHVGACLVIPNGADTCIYDTSEVRQFVDAIASFWSAETAGRAFLTRRACPTIYTQPETTVFVEGYPVDAAMTPDGRKLYVAKTKREAGAVTVIDTDPASPTFHTVLRHISLPENHASGGRAGHSWHGGHRPGVLAGRQLRPDRGCRRGHRRARQHGDACDPPGGDARRWQRPLRRRLLARRAEGLRPREPGPPGQGPQVRAPRSAMRRTMTWAGARRTDTMVLRCSTASVRCPGAPWRACGKLGMAVSRVDSSRPRAYLLSTGWLLVDDGRRLGCTLGEHAVRWTVVAVTRGRGASPVGRQSIARG
jgi:hypothetical protein